MTKFFDRLDRRLVLLVLGLLVAGTVLVFGASAYELGLEEQTPYAKVLGHLQKGLLALLVCATVATVPYRKTARVAEWGLWISIFGLLLLLTPLPIVRASAGIPRWLDLGPIVVQPSEFAKLSLVLTLPLWIDRDPARLTRGPKEQLRLIAPFLAIAFLLAMQPNYGSIVAIGTIVMGVLWVGGLSLRYFLFGGTAVFFAAWFGFTHVSKLVSRLDAWKLLLFSEKFADDIGRQAFHAQMGLGNGGLLGVKAGSGVTRYRFVPESDTDFVFAVAGEEWGFVGALVLALAFAMIVARALKIARRSRDGLAYLMAVAIGLMLASYAIMNLCMVTGLIPVVGLPLPFLSLGGSALLTNMAAVGVLLNIAARAQKIRGDQARWSGVKA